MGIIYAISNEKGGQAKTTTAAALAEGTAKKGYTVLAIDADPQAALTYELAGIDAAEPGLYEILTGSGTPATATITTRTEGVHLWGASAALAGIDHKLTGEDRLFTMRRALEGIRDKVDYVFIDCPAMVNTLQLNAILAADQLIIPATPDGYSARSIMHTLQVLEDAKEQGNPELKLAGVLFTRCRGLATQKTVIASAREQLGRQVFKTTIRERAAVQYASIMGGGLWDGRATKDTAEDYTQLLKELGITSRKGRK